MRGWKRWAAIAVGGLVGVVAFMYGVGALLPVGHTATASRVVAGDIERVWGVMTDVEGFASWRPGIDATERLEAVGGLPVWRESGPMGATTLEVTELDPPNRMVARIADEGPPFGGTWTYELDRAAGGTRVTLTEDGEVYNPFYRFVSRFIMGYDGTMNAYLDGLEARMAPGGGG